MSENHHSRFYVASSDLQGLYALKIAYLFFSLVSLGLTVYVLLVWRVSLPSFDIIDYHEFLSSAANGVLLRDDLWVRHNGAHLIFLPRLVFFVDMWMGRGSGVITTLVSCAAILGTVYIFCRAVFRLDVVDKNEKLFFCLLIFFVMTSDIVLESLLNPVDIQWSLLALGSVLLAYGFGLCCEGVVGAGLGYVLVGSLVSYFSAGPLFLMLVASLAAFAIAFFNSLEMRRRCAYGFLLLAMVAVCWEFYAWHTGHRLLLPLLIKPVEAPVDWREVAEKFLHENPAYYCSLFYKCMVFVGSYIGLPLASAGSQDGFSVAALLVWLALLVKSLPVWSRKYIFFIYLIVFSFLVALAAGLLRAGGLYSYRHANIGFLLLVSSLLLIYVACAGKYRVPVFVSCMLLYGVGFMWVAVEEAGEWAAWGRESLRSSQIGNAMGVNDPSWFKYVWKFGWQEEKAEHSRRVFREQQVGIYGSAAYRRYADQLPLPAQQIECEYGIKSFSQVNTDHRAFRIQGMARTAQGVVLGNIMFLDETGKYIGYGLSEMPSHSLLDQLRLPWHWGGYILFVKKPLPVSVTLVAFDDNRRCQPWIIPLPTDTHRE